MSKNHNVLNKDEIAFLGASLRAIEQNLIKQGYNQGTKRIWFQGNEPYFDVFFELKNDKILWFEFTLRGQFLSWSETTGWQTGNTNELKIADVSFYPASKIIDNDYAIDCKFINVVKLILQTRAEEAIFTKALALFHQYGLSSIIENS